MVTHDEITPTDRPLMRSDLDAVRKALQQVMTWQIATHRELQRSKWEPRFLAAVCLACALISIASAVGAQ